MSERDQAQAAYKRIRVLLQNPESIRQGRNNPIENALNIITDTNQLDLL